MALNCSILLSKDSFSISDREKHCLFRLGISMYVLERRLENKRTNFEKEWQCIMQGEEFYDWYCLMIHASVGEARTVLNVDCLAC